MWEWFRPALPGDIETGYQEAFLYEGMVKHWNSEEVVDAPSLPVFKRQLDYALNNMISVLVSPEPVRRLD